MASKRLRNANSNEGEELNVDMSPMIDMVFLLLLFFLVAATAKVVKIDSRIEVPIAHNAKKPESKLGRVVLNVYGSEHEAEGRYRSEDGNTEYSDDAALLDYFKKSKDAADARAIKPRLHLRGHTKVEFKHVRKAIRVAAEAGISEVIFASYITGD